MEKRKKKRLLPHIFRDRVIVAFLVLLQIVVIVALAVSGASFSPYISIALNVVSFLISLAVIIRRTKDAYKLIWIYLILCFPVFGGLFYLVFSIQSSMKLMEPYMKEINEKTSCKTSDSDASTSEAISEYPEQVNQIRYLSDYAGFPAFANTDTVYYPTGEDFYPALLDALRSAKKYIFMEYFIIAEGKMWDSVVEILAQKASEGVDVRVMYDDVGSIFQLPKKYPHVLAQKGIKCRAFNRFRPILTGLQNNRDHRKICSVDGKIAFTGGVNLADEYINEIERFGRWKDCAVKLTGDAAWSLTVIFLKMWMLTSTNRHSNTFDIQQFMPEKQDDAQRVFDGYVQPYCDSPLDTDHVAEHVYLQMIGQAKDYLYIYTPYFIVDDTIITALTLAAKSGVDVRIVTPHKWDKLMVHITTRSYYRDLIDGGVKVYEYTPGFIHSKVFVSDDRVASIGTVNLDFRSLYLHFECGTMLYGSHAVMQAKEDFLRTVKECKEITEKDCKTGIFMRLVNCIMRLIAPLL